MRGEHNNHIKSSKHYRWNNRLKSTEGYTKIRVGKSHPLSDPNGYVYEQKLVAVTAFGLDFIKGKIIHHINGNKSDNRLENIEILTRSEHNKLHNKSKQRDLSGKFIKKKARRLLDGKVWDQYPEVSHD